VEVNAVGRAKTASRISAGWTDISNAHRDDQTQNPTARRKHRHVHVVQHEHLVPQHVEQIEIVGPLLMRNRRHRGLQPRDVRLEGDGHLVAEAALHARADGAEEPCRGS
jgi:hypothetical protein